MTEGTLKKFSVTIEIAAPMTVDTEDVIEYIRSILSDSEISNENDVFALGDIEVVDEETISIDEWNGDEEDIDFGEI